MSQRQQLLVVGRNPFVHYVLVAVQSYTAGYDPVVEGYVKFRATLVPAGSRE
jgi:hypothetical protein